MDFLGDLFGCMLGNIRKRCVNKAKEMMEDEKIMKKWIKKSNLLLYLLVGSILLFAGCCNKNNQEESSIKTDAKAVETEVSEMEYSETEVRAQEKPETEESEAVDIPQNLKVFPIMVQGYDAINYPCDLVLQDGDFVGVYGTYDEMVESCKGYEDAMYAPPFIEEGRIRTVSKWDAPLDEWFDGLFTYEEFIGEVWRLAKELDSSEDFEDADTAQNLLTKNMIFYEYDGESEITLELYPDNTNEGRLILTLKLFDENGDILVSDNVNGYYELSARGYVVYDDNWQMLDTTFSLDLNSTPAK